MSADGQPDRHPVSLPHSTTALLLDVSARIRPQLVHELQSRGFTIVDGEAADLAQAGMVIIEADRGPAMMAAVREVRAQLPGAVVIGITGWWNDLEPEVRREATAVLHAPLSSRECRSVLSTAGR